MFFPLKNNAQDTGKAVVKIEENSQRASRVIPNRYPLQPALKSRPKIRSNRLLNVTLWTTVKPI
jgi:hypothetical protein